ncbi:IMPACT family member YvyE [Diplonema papillatum]|nr:IMPACT family member YvyE [Diplonema papillatum]
MMRMWHARNAVATLPLRQLRAKAWKRPQQDGKQGESASGAAAAGGDVTVAGECIGPENVIKGSVFVARIAPAADEREARAFAKQLKEPGVTHSCWAYRGYGFDSRASDDGEPRGTAGEPILQALTEANVRQAVVAVTRVYGGVKLGTGGLFHAYGDTARSVLREAETKPLGPDPRF